MPLPLVSFPTLGWQVRDWMEELLCHGPGDVQGDRFELDDEEVLFLCWAYRVWPEGHRFAGRRLIHHATYSRPKGRRKSEFAGAIVCAEALGPVRSDGFDASGEPVGMPVKYPFIRCLATEEEQSGNTYDNVTYMLEHGKAASLYAVDTGLTRTFIKEPGGGEIVPSTSGDASKDGGKETFSVADETHLYVARKPQQMYRTVARNTGKRKIAQPWMLDTTTAWLPSEHSVAEQTAERFEGMPTEEAVTKRGVLYDHRQGDVPKRFGDDRSLIKAMRPGYGPAAEWMDFQRIVKIIREAEDPEAEAYRFFLNIPRVGITQWLMPEEIKPVLSDFEVEEGSMVTLGFDGSESDDHTALVGCTEDGDLFAIGIWTPTHDDLGWRADVMEVVDWAMDAFDVKRLYGDPPWWQDEMGKWASKYGSPPVTEFWTNVDSKMAVACGALRTQVRQKACRINPVPLRTEEQFRGGKSLLVWHFENARTRKVRVRLDDKAEEAFTVRKERPGSDLKIDSVPSAVLARRACDDETKAGGWKPKRPAQLITF